MSQKGLIYLTNNLLLRNSQPTRIDTAHVLRQGVDEVQAHVIRQGVVRGILTYVVRQGVDKVQLDTHVLRQGVVRKC